MSWFVEACLEPGYLSFRGAGATRESAVPAFAQKQISRFARNDKVLGLLKPASCLITCHSEEPRGDEGLRIMPREAPEGRSSQGGPMEFKLKTISAEAIEAALSKVELYRFLNEPEEAESICQDVLAVEPGHQLALRFLGLAITDQFTGSTSDRYAEVENAFQQLTDRYEKLYYTGLLHERRAKAQLRAGRPPHTLLVLLEEAMHSYEEAEKIRPTGNDDAILRWNRCARLIHAYAESDWHREVELFEMGDTAP
jgi:tetratricopeptide (TPR) repeat protein